MSSDLFIINFHDICVIRGFGRAAEEDEEDQMAGVFGLWKLKYFHGSWQTSLSCAWTFHISDWSTSSSKTSTIDKCVTSTKKWQTYPTYEAQVHKTFPRMTMTPYLNSRQSKTVWLNTWRRRSRNLSLSPLNKDSTWLTTFFFISW